MHSCSGTDPVGTRSGTNSNNIGLKILATQAASRSGSAWFRRRRLGRIGLRLAIQARKRSNCDCFPSPRSNPERSIPDLNTSNGSRASPGGLGHRRCFLTASSWGIGPEYLAAESMTRTQERTG
jgi:hypothetical protein